MVVSRMRVVACVVVLLVRGQLVRSRHSVPIRGQQVVRVGFKLRGTVLREDDDVVGARDVDIVRARLQRRVEVKELARGR